MWNKIYWICDLEAKYSFWISQHRLAIYIINKTSRAPNSPLSIFRHICGHGYSLVNGSCPVGWGILHNRMVGSDTLQRESSWLPTNWMCFPLLFALRWPVLTEWMLPNEQHNPQTWFRPLWSCIIPLGHLDLMEQQTIHFINCSQRGMQSWWTSLLTLWE